MYLVIDVGNTCVKIGIYQKSKLIKHEIVEKSLIVCSVKGVLEQYNIDRGIISSVSSLSKAVINDLDQMLCLIHLDHRLKVPFINEYSTPQSLGVDRIALVTAAVSLYPNTNVLVIDAGTCVTFDFVSFKSHYYGGAISPGISLRYKSLHDYTKNLPFLEKTHCNKLIGNDTNSSIHSGIVNGIVNEIEGVIDQYKRKFENLTIVLTGGDAFFLSKQLKSGIFAIQNFLLDGLYRILIYNIDNDKKNR